MPIGRIQILEYESVRCGYKWINRVNGHDGPIPQKCARCKRSGWNGGEKDIITPTEMGLRRRIKYFKSLYEYAPLYFGITIDWPNGLCEKFVDINPRPTIGELNQVLSPPGGLGLTSQNQGIHRGYVPDPDRPGQWKYDNEEYLKILKQEAQKRIELMLQRMKSRGINDCDLAAVIIQQHKRAGRGEEPNY
ncbi:MAG TPA: hypothetical protein VI033_05110 [Candidatus Nitrosopolaris sp.]